MFGFFKSAFRPFVSIGQKIGSLLGIGRKVARPMGVVREPLMEFVNVGRAGQSAFQGGEAGKFYGSVGGMLSDFKYPV
jgi:hypothetical protein